jgi:hypothetical protein
MSEEEGKVIQQQVKARPKVHTMKLCIVSMEYKIKNKDKTPNLRQLNESYKDAEKVRDLFETTLGWDLNDITKFYD